ncbi:PepSY-associated TM helix domain-containing protein [Spirosoma validum]|uniref:PepSY domain-containing protein n=1 Tax=Spirosoma validum TaxID=2771355 RepID=A0A927GCU3_9BACT|nr:PepSY-associated TM helix domain-containing protein [Spirosoma validum]MBD2753024.1 PepSY domain-containing protein [Spirosoma validum]
MSLKTVKKKKESSRSLFYRISAWLHLWLGLITGIVMIIVCLTGCIWVFQDEITSVFLEPESNVARQEKPVIQPSQIMAIAGQAYPGKRVSYAMYHQGKAIEVNIGGRRRGGTTLKLNPYTGQIISKTERKEGQVSFFRWILNGHRFLWLPFEIGRPIVNYSTLIFVITLITGMVLWWPQKWTTSTRQQSFSIKWNGKFKRVNYDLHNVLGFYSLLVVMAISLTGMVYGIEWFSKGLYWTTSGGKTLPGFNDTHSDTLQTRRPYTPAQAMDLAWNKVARKHPEAKGFYMTFPDSSERKTVINVTVYPSIGKFYDNQGYAFDQFTLAEMPKHEVYGTSFSEAPAGAKLRRMNYDIHVGSILGLPGKILAFFASLIGASLPITGFIIWWGKQKKGKKGKGRKSKESAGKLPNAVPSAQAIRPSPIRAANGTVLLPTVQPNSTPGLD